MSDLIHLELHDLLLGDRSGSVVFRFGKGNKQRTVPRPFPARRSLQTYLDGRPPHPSRRVFIGERGPITERGVRAWLEISNEIPSDLLLDLLKAETTNFHGLIDGEKETASLNKRAELLGQYGIHISVFGLVR